MDEEIRRRHFLLLQINDALFPIGGYSHSYGLETYIQKDLVRTPEQAMDFIRNRMLYGFCYNEFLGARLAWEYAKSGDLGAILHLEELLEASRIPRETRDAGNKLGSRFIKTVRGMQIPYESEIFARYCMAKSGAGGDGSGHGTGPGVGDGTDSGTGSGVRDGSSHGTGPGVGDGTGSGTGSGVGDGSGHGTGPGVGDGTDSGTGSGVGGCAAVTVSTIAAKSKSVTATGSASSATHCVVYGVFCAACGIPLEDAMENYLYAQASSMVTNCVKTIPLSQTTGQHMLYNCQDIFIQISKVLRCLTEDDLCRSAPGFDIRCMQHEGLYSRIYMS